MQTIPTRTLSPLVHRVAFRARTLLAVSVLAALAVTSGSLAQTPTFSPLVTTSTGNPNYEHPNLAGVGDFNGDGKSDALLSTGSENLRLMLGNGNGTFTQLYVSTPGAGNQYAVRVADLNGDGRLDAITASNQGNLAAAVLINTGNDLNDVPQFTVTNYVNPGFGTSGLRSLTIGDLNGGKPDFIVGNAHGALRVWLNNGDGTFTGGQYYSIQPSAGSPSTGPGVIVDLNGDGKGDFLESSGQASATNIFFGNGDGTLQAPVVIQLPGRSPGPIAAADLNNDGKPDFVEAVSDGSLAVFLNPGNGTFGAPTSYQLPPTGNPSDLVYINQTTSVAIADINGDGKLDLVAGYAQQWYASYGIAMFTGNGDGTFGPVTKISMNAPPLDVSVNDFNGDSKPDIARVGYNDNTYGVLLNTTVFAPPLPTQTLTILGGSGNPGDLAANVEYYNPATGNWQPAYLTGGHPWGFVTGTNSWINYKMNTASDPGAGPTTNQTLWYLYRVRFTVPADAVNPQMTFSVKADNFAQIAINGVTAGGSQQFINNAYVNNVVVGGADQVNADAVFSQNVHPGENTITLNVGDWGGLNGFNFRIDLTVQSQQPLEIVPPKPADTTPPVITAPANITQEAGPLGNVVTFSASAVDDKDGPVSVVAIPPSGSTFALGTTTVDLGAQDSAGNHAEASFTVTIQDTTPPSINTPANIGPIEATGPLTPVSYTATATDLVDGAVTVTATPASSSFPVGTTSVRLDASDSRGNAASSSFTVTIVDTTAPSIASVTPSSGTLWPPNHQMVPISISAVASDLVGVASLKIVSVTSSEPDNGLGDGDTANDIQITGDLTVNLRAERGGKGNGRTYTITVEASDAAGNTTTKTCTVSVPKSQGKK